MHGCKHGGVVDQVGDFLCFLWVQEFFVGARVHVSCAVKMTFDHKPSINVCHVCGFIGHVLIAFLAAAG